MAQAHLIRVGVMGQIGRFVAVDAAKYARHSRVLVRTARGLEIGEVVTPPNETGENGSHGNADGELLRRLSVEDELLSARLEKNRSEALESCSGMLTEKSIPATLLDVEHLFDGQGLYFYFLGTVPPDIESHLVELSERYEAVAKFRQFTEALTEGCGPDCGTESATGGGCDSCSSCGIKTACAVRG